MRRSGVKTRAIGKSTLVSTRLAYGCWRICGTWDPKEVTPERASAGKRAVVAAYEAGYTLFDHADIYCRGMCETLFGQVLREVPGMRKRVLVATKCGIRFAGEPNPDSPQRYDFSRDHIISSCEASLRRLGVETIDLYQLHRPDYLMDPSEVAGAFERLRSDGKVRFFGVSNFSPSQLSALQSACPFPLVVNQVEIHLGRLEPFSDGTLDQCLEKQITPLAWSPLGGGLVTPEGNDNYGTPKRPRESVLPLVDLLQKTAAAYDAAPAQIALAWLLKHPAGIVPIVGTITPDRIVEATRADDIDLSREDWYRLLVAARGEPLP
jgi:predicted oxidoreductase